MKITDTKSIKLAIKRGETIEMLAKDNNMTQEAICEKLKNFYYNENEYIKIEREFRRNMKKKHKLQDTNSTNHENVILENETVENVTVSNGNEVKEIVENEVILSNSTTYENNSKTLENIGNDIEATLKLQIEEASKKCIILEKVNKEIVAKRSTLVSSMQRKARVIAKISKILNQMEVELFLEESQYFKCGSKMEKFTNKISILKRDLDEYRERLEKAKKLEILVFNDCGILATKGDEDVEVLITEDANTQEEMLKFINLPEVSELTINQLRTVLGVKKFVSNMKSAGKPYSVEFENLAMKAIFDF